MFYKLWHATYFRNNDGNQVELVKSQDYNVNAPYAYKTYAQGNAIDSEVRLPDLQLSTNASMSDYLSVAGVDSFYMVISEKCKNAMQDLHMPKTKFIPINVLADRPSQYFGMHFEESDTNDFVDWQTSLFAIRKGRLGDVIESNIKFNSFDDFLKKKRSVAIESEGVYSLRDAKISLNTEFTKHDLFFSNNPTFGIFCNTRFLEIIINSGLTGFRVERIDNGSE